MAHLPHNELDILRLPVPRRRVLQSLVGAAVALVGLTGCGGEEEDDEEEGDEEAEDDD